MNRYTLTTTHGDLNLYATHDEQIVNLIRSIREGDYTLTRIDEIEQVLPHTSERTTP